MSRYDWDQTHSGITRLENAVGEARTRVVTHPLYANLDTHTAIITYRKYWIEPSRHGQDRYREGDDRAERCG